MGTEGKGKCGCKQPQPVLRAPTDLEKGMRRAGVCLSRNTPPTVSSVCLFSLQSLFPWEPVCVWVGETLPQSYCLPWDATSNRLEKYCQGFTCWMCVCVCIPHLCVSIVSIHTDALCVSVCHFAFIYSYSYFKFIKIHTGTFQNKLSSKWSFVYNQTHPHFLALSLAPKHTFTDRRDLTNPWCLLGVKASPLCETY